MRERLLSFSRTFHHGCPPLMTTADREVSSPLITFDRTRHRTCAEHKSWCEHDESSPPSSLICVRKQAINVVLCRSPSEDAANLISVDMVPDTQNPCVLQCARVPLRRSDIFPEYIVRQQKEWFTLLRQQQWYKNNCSSEQGVENNCSFYRQVKTSPRTWPGSPEQKTTLGTTCQL